MIQLTSEYHFSVFNRTKKSIIQKKLELIGSTILSKVLIYELIKNNPDASVEVIFHKCMGIKSSQNLIRLSNKYNLTNLIVTSHNPLEIASACMKSYIGAIAMQESTLEAESFVREMVLLELHIKDKHLNKKVLKIPPVFEGVSFKDLNEYQEINGNR